MSHLIRRHSLPRSRETSRYNSPRDFQSPGNLWKHVQAGNNRAESLTDAVAKLAKQVQKISKGNHFNYEMHPFKLYQLPSVFRTVADDGKNWRRWRVRMGMVFEDAVGFQVTGTDKVAFPYLDLLTVQADATTIAGVTDIVVPEEEPYFYFWIELNTDHDAGVIRYGPDPDVSSYTDPDQTWTSTNPWTTYPDFDAEHIYIGFVDTETLFAQKVALPFQVQDEHVMGISSSSCPP